MTNYNRSDVMKQAWTIYRREGGAFSYALKKAWELVKLSFYPYIKEIKEFQSIRVPYSLAKSYYAGCETIAKSYDFASKTIELKIDAVTFNIMCLTPVNALESTKASRYSLATEIKDTLLNALEHCDELKDDSEPWLLECEKWVKALRYLTFDHSGYFNVKTLKWVEL